MNPLHHKDSLSLEQRFYKIPSDKFYGEITNYSRNVNKIIEMVTNFLASLNTC